MNARKTLTAALSALALGATLVATATPAEAKYGRNGAFFGGLAAGIVGTMALGAIASSPSYAAPVYGGGCYITRQPITNGWGEVVGFRRVRVCE